MANNDFITYVLDDKSSFYNGRKVVLVRDMGGICRLVKVAGTNIELVATLRELARP